MASSDIWRHLWPLVSVRCLKSLTPCELWPTRAWSINADNVPTRSTSRYLIVSRRRLATDPQLIHRLHSHHARLLAGHAPSDLQLPSIFKLKHRSARPPLLAAMFHSFHDGARVCCYPASFSITGRGRPAGRPPGRATSIVSNCFSDGAARAAGSPPNPPGRLLNSYARWNFKLIYSVICDVAFGATS